MSSPFFTRFLEGQKIAKPEAERVAGGRPIQTMKYPSDADEPITMKYPSDDDEGPIGI